MESKWKVLFPVMLMRLNMTKLKTENKATNLDIVKNISKTKKHLKSIGSNTGSMKPFEHVPKTVLSFVM